MELSDFKNSDLFVEELLLMKLINEGEDVGAYKFFSNKETILNSLEANLFIKRTEDGYELRSKGRELFGNKNDVSFEDFWNKYHLITKLPKSDREAASKYWKRLKSREKLTALNNVEKYYNSLSEKKYCKKARTYLADKNFNDEFRVINNGTTKSIFSLAGKD